MYLDLSEADTERSRRRCGVQSLTIGAFPHRRIPTQFRSREIRPEPTRESLPPPSPYDRPRWARDGDVSVEIQTGRTADDVGVAAKAGVRIMVWCKLCQHHLEADPAEMIARFGARVAVLDRRLWCSRRAAWNRHGPDRAASEMGGYRAQAFRSQRSFSGAAAMVCHCMFVTASGPPQASGRTWSLSVTRTAPLVLPVGTGGPARASEQTQAKIEKSGQKPKNQYHAATRADGDSGDRSGL